jgi:hypothetical protein
VKLLLFLFLPFFLKIQIHQSIGRLSNHRPNTESCGVCVWREQLLPSLRLNHISLILYLQTQFARRLVLTRIIKEPASRIAELSDQINKDEGGGGGNLKKKRRGRWIWRTRRISLLCSFDKYYMNLRYLVIHQNKILFFENKKCWARGGVMGIECID